MPRLSRRAVLLGGGSTAAVAAAGAAGVHQGVLPGRVWAQARLGLNGEAGVVPDVAPGPVITGSFRSEHRGGVETGWALARPPAAVGTLPLVVALHPLGSNHAKLLGPELELDRFLAAQAAEGPSYAVATVDGGTSYWHPRPDGEDASAMVVDELLPLLAQHDVDTTRFGLLGWSMGGYGALRLAGLLGPERVLGVAVASPALWTDADEASPTGFADADEYEQHSVLGRQADLDGIPVRLECGTGDPFYRATEEYADGFPAGAEVTASFEPGAHDGAYWRRVLPGQLSFLGRRLDA
ncbi:alpha/beta hydrolase-fold protein [Nocardioides sp. W7]|uniref:alpha/beta hydrolase n=1 Tax=Nocardioides sp. W7 TaxID=2931390 RepID=UPI001FD0A558|nr:alpha/beta hydrolase-fold protein [Nocardioides sp. W7]